MRNSSQSFKLSNYGESVDIRIKSHYYRLILKMRSLFVLVALIFTVVNGAKSSMVKSINDQYIHDPSKGSQCDEAPVNDCNCHCNLHQDSSLKYAIEALETKLEHLITLVNKTSLPKSTPSAEKPSCKEQYEKDNSSRSQVYTLKFGSRKVPVYCHMGDFGCGDGGWTLAMKIDGTKITFHYDSPLWSDRNVHNLAGGKTGFDHQETKLPSYWNTPFSKICLGMKIGHQIKFITINKDANSLFSLIADGNYRSTSSGRNTWKKLIGSEASLQQYCNREGFNAKCRSSSFSKARIGILGSDRLGNCVFCRSRVGFGMGGKPDDSSTCGNVAADRADDETKDIKAMGYILVQ